MRRSVFLLLLVASTGGMAAKSSSMEPSAQSEPVFSSPTPSSRPQDLSMHAMTAPASGNDQLDSWTQGSLNSIRTGPFSQKRKLRRRRRRRPLLKRRREALIFDGGQAYNRARHYYAGGPVEHQGKPRERRNEDYGTKPFREATFDEKTFKWICPVPARSIKKALGNVSIDEEDSTDIPDVSTTKLRDEAKEASPLSLTMAKELDSSANNTNFRRVFAQLAGIHLPRKRFHQASAFGGGVTGRAARAQMAEPAFCQPEIATVVIPVPEDSRPGVFYYPTCTRIERCAGCCSHNLLECQPRETEEIDLKVTRTEFVMGELKFAGEEIITMEKHTKCACDCKIKEENCHSGQVYLPHECRCLCRNTNQEHLCKAQPNLRFWDPSECRCRCKRVVECSTGMIYNNKTCKCERKKKSFGGRAVESFTYEETLEA